MPQMDLAHWRKRAEEMRRLADQTTDAEEKQLLFGLAADYDRLAKRAEDRQKPAV